LKDFNQNAIAVFNERTEMKTTKKKSPESEINAATGVHGTKK
jgi:hypothetical protein